MSAYPLISTTELAARLGEPGLVVLDASVDLPRPEHDGDHRATSGAAGWRSGRIPGSGHLDLLHEFTASDAGFHFAQPTPEHAARVLGRLGVRDGSTLVVYDRHDGFWGARAWWSLRALGVQARVLDGGLRAWQDDGHPVEAGTTPAAPAPRSVDEALTLHPRPELWATKADVLAAIDGASDVVLVCALGRDQFTGTTPTRYSRRGHIPTSLNLPARDLAAASGRLLPVEQLWDAARGFAGSEVLLYCGGGISASYAALGLVVAGHARIRIYDGSLEEWSSEPDLPLTV